MQRPTRRNLTPLTYIRLAYAHYLHLQVTGDDRMVEPLETADYFMPCHYTPANTASK